jgi:hypothetical protein
MTELEQHLLASLDKLEKDFATSLENQSQAIKALESKTEKQNAQLLCLSGLYGDLERFLERLSALLNCV